VIADTNSRLAAFDEAQKGGTPMPGPKLDYCNQPIESKSHTEDSARQ